MFPGDSFSCSRSYGPVSQADIDAGRVDNVATASFDLGGLTVTSPSSSASVVADVVPALSLEKTALAADGGVQYDTLGEEIVYSFAVRNDSTQTLSSVVVSDPLVPGFSCTITDLGPGVTDDTSCEMRYVVTQPDLDAGSILNTASALGTSPTGATQSASDSAVMTIDPAAQTRVLGLEKSASLSGFAAVGDEIFYAIEVSNLGNLTLQDVVIEDAALGLRCVIGALAPLASDDSCVGSHVVTQDDVDAGSYVNEATASATGALDVQSDVVVPGPVRAPSFTVEKTASADVDVSVGTVVVYRHEVENTGNVTLTDITLTDRHTSSSGVQDLVFSPSNVIGTLAPGERVTVTTRYTITQADIDAGTDVANTVSATAVPPAGTTPPTASDDESVDLEDGAPSVSIVKTESDGTGSFGNLPSSEVFTFEVRNTGNVTLVGFEVEDASAGFSCVLGDLAPGAVTGVCGDGTVLSATVEIDQGDIDLGSLSNTVTVGDGTVTARDDVTLSGPDQLPVLSVVKTATSGAGFDAVGDTISYEYVVTNAGNITLSAPISVADDKTNVTCPALPVGGLAPGASILCTSSYAVVQADLDAGDVVNLASASIRQPVVPSVTHPDGTADDAVDL